MFDFIQRQTSKHSKQGIKLRVLSQLMQLEHPIGRIKFYSSRANRLQWEQASLLFALAGCHFTSQDRELRKMMEDIQKEIDHAERQIRIAELKLKVYGSNRVQK